MRFGDFKVKFKIALGSETGAQVADEKKPEVKNLIRLSLSLCCVPDRLGLIFVFITAYRAKTTLTHACS